jgi:hypothetical protein
LIDRQYHELFVPAGWQEDINKLGSFVATIQANKHCCDGLIFWRLISVSPVQALIDTNAGPRGTTREILSIKHTCNTNGHHE